jgi:cystathionine beta-lyase/cystathionine gamma-synthase
MREHIESGLVVAKFLEKHPAIERVVCPSLPSHPDYELTLKQQKGLQYHLFGFTNIYLSNFSRNNKKKKQSIITLKVSTVYNSKNSFINKSKCL